MRYELLSVGSSSIDTIDGRTSYGGSATNVAYNCANLGLKTALNSVFANEQASREYESYLESMGITLFDFDSRLEQLPRFEVETNPHDNTRTINWMPNGYAQAYANADPKSAYLRSSKVVHLATCEQSYALKVATMTSDKQLLSYNPGPWLYKPDSAYFFENIFLTSRFIFVNEQEAESLKSAGFYRNLEDLTHNEKQVFIITRGAKSTLLIANNKVQEVPTVPANLVDESGAGDAFCSAFLWCFENGFSSEDAVKYGNLLGSRVVEQYGCQLERGTFQDFKSKIL